jgi:hypothetical protein
MNLENIVNSLIESEKSELIKLLSIENMDENIKI